jgi:hypothetical protein
LVDCRFAIGSNGRKERGNIPVRLTALFNVLTFVCREGNGVEMPSHNLGVLQRDDRWGDDPVDHSPWVFEVLKIMVTTLSERDDKRR